MVGAQVSQSWCKLDERKFWIESIVVPLLQRVSGLWWTGLIQGLKFATFTTNAKKGNIEEYSKVFKGIQGHKFQVLLDEGQ